jgi:phosphoglycolate phosphatase
MSAPLLFEQQPVEAILFDLDGTLLDTALDLGAAVNVLLARDQLAQLSESVIYQTASQGALALIKAGFGDELSNQRLTELRAQFLDCYHTNIAQHTQYFSGAEQLLQLLNTQNIPWGIVTNKPYIYTKLLQIKFPLLASALVTLCGDSMAVRKPDPLPLIVAAKSLAIAPQRIAYVGDAITDIMAANSAAMVSIAAAYGYIPDGENVDNWNADLILNNCNDLLRVLTKKHT